MPSGAGSASIIHSHEGVEDEAKPNYGIPGASNQGRWRPAPDPDPGHTGQAWIPELGLYHYKARAYSPTLGRFLQTDPIGYGDGMNLSAYVRNDPVNRVDPWGLCAGSNTAHREGDVITVCAGFSGGFFFLNARNSALAGARAGGGGRGSSTRPVAPAHGPPPAVGEQPGGGDGVAPAEIVVNATRKPGHNYHISRRLTSMNTRCTLDQVSQVANENSVPGSPGPHISGETYRVSLFGISPGHIQFESTADTRSFTNVTLDDHWLRYGTVGTTISGSQRDGFVAHVSGTGTNINAFWAGVNQELGPKIVSMQLARMHMAVLGACGG